MKDCSFILLLVFVLVLHLPVFSQSDPAKGKVQFTDEKFSFKYPPDWNINDKSNKYFQQFNLVPKDGNALIMVIAFRPKVSTYDDFEQLKTQIGYSLIDKMLQGFSNSVKSNVCLDIGNHTVPGFRVAGLHDQKTSSGDVFSFAVKGKYFQIVYMRNDEDMTRSDSAWKTLVESFKVDGNEANDSSFLIDFENDSVLNGKAVKLPKPMFPSGIKSLIPINVRVRVTIDENGDVISAKASDSNLQFRNFAIEAAKKAKFSPTTICGKLAKITGIISYKFVF